MLRFSVFDFDGCFTLTLGISSIYYFIVEVCFMFSLDLVLAVQPKKTPVLLLYGAVIRCLDKVMI